MSERKLLMLISLGMGLVAIACGVVFVLTGFDVLWMFATAAFIMGSFMAFLIGITA